MSVNMSELELELDEVDEVDNVDSDGGEWNRYSGCAVCTSINTNLSHNVVTSRRNKECNERCRHVPLIAAEKQMTSFIQATD